MSKQQINFMTDSIETSLEWILSIKRKYNTDGDNLLCSKLNKIPGIAYDTFGNLILRLGDDGKPMSLDDSQKNQAKVLFSAHTDTVHWTSGTQKVYKDTVKQEYFIKTKDGCLGADDGAGIVVLLALIKVKTPGLYIFHRGEECGGLGSSFIAKTTPELITGIDIAIAFDRRGKTDIINHQSCGKCCSDKFVTSLANQIKLGHSKARGSFTDTSNYAGIIPECTNVSVGYSREHTSKETLHYGYLYMLISRVLTIDFSALVVKRKTDDFGTPAYTFGYNGYTSGRGYRKPHIQKIYTSMKGLREIVQTNPELAVQLLWSTGVTEDDIDWEQGKIDLAQERKKKYARRNTLEVVT